jgi:hypothetical protein
VKLTNDMENFAIDLTDNSQSHEDWLSVVRFGMGTLLENQALFFEIIWREAEKQLKRKGVESRKLSDEAVQIFRELKLKVSVIE